jgi:hypothetical protein
VSPTPTQVIVVAFGCEIRDTTTHRDVVDHLNRVARGPSSSMTWTYTAGRRQFEVRLVYTKKEFGQSLDIPGAIVVYDGHSRYGQGPAFGPAGLPHCPDVATFPANPWGDHFRMGYDALQVPCIEEIFDHCTEPTEYAVPTRPDKAFLPRHVRKVLIKAKGRSARCNQRGYARRLLRTCFPTEAAKVNGRGVASLHARHFWYTTRGGADFMTLVGVGAGDLRSSKLKCKVLFMNSCSSREHFLAALRQRKKSANSKCVFYMTREVCSASTTVIFVRRILEGYDPVSEQGSRKLLRDMNGLADAGAIELVS